MYSGDITVFDIETDGLLDDVSKVHCIAIQHVDEGEGFLYHKATGTTLHATDYICGHNIINYDLPAMEKCGYDFNYDGGVIDTLVLSQLLYPADFLYKKDAALVKKYGDERLPSHLRGKHSLEAWGCRLGIHKGDFGKTTDWSTYTDEMGEYCKQDVAVNVALMKHFQSRFEHIPTEALEMEMKFKTMISEQERNGWLLDKDKAVTLYAELCGVRQELEEDIKSIHGGWYEEMKTPEYYSYNDYALNIKEATKGMCEDKAYEETRGIMGKGPTRAAIKALIKAGPMKQKHTPFNSNSRHHIAKLFKERYNWTPKDFTKGGDPRIDGDVLKDLPYPEALKLNTLLDNAKIIGMIAEGDNAWLKMMDSETGRIHGQVNTNGTRTRRCTHYKPNLAQVPVFEGLGKRCRELFIIPEGYKLVGADASGLELRMLSHYLHKYDGGAYGQIVLHGDIHTANQESAGLATRNEAKTFIYAYLYGSGANGLANTFGWTVHQARKTMKQFLAANPFIGKLRDSLIAEYTGNNGWLESLDGIPIWNPSQHTALNTCLQAAGAIFMKRACTIFEERLQDSGLKEHVKMVGQVHDESQLEVLDKDDLPDTVGKMMVQSFVEAGHYYNLNIPMDGEYAVGDDWSQTH